MERVDSDLLQQIEDGDADALDFVIGQLKYYLIMRFKGSPCVMNDAEGIAIDAILRALKKRDEFRGESKLMTWLQAFACNAAREHRRKYGKDETLETEHELIADSRPNPEEQLAEEEETQLKRAYAQDARFAVSDREYEAFEATYIKGMGVKKYAEQQGTSEDAISSLLRRAKLKMREKLKGIAW